MFIKKRKKRKKNRKALPSMELPPSAPNCLFLSCCCFFWSFCSVFLLAVADLRVDQMLAFLPAVTFGITMSPTPKNLNIPITFDWPVKEEGMVVKPDYMLAFSAPKMRCFDSSSSLYAPQLSLLFNFPCVRGRGRRDSSMMFCGPSRPCRHVCGQQ